MKSSLFYPTGLHFFFFIEWYISLFLSLLHIFPFLVWWVLLQWKKRKWEVHSLIVEETRLGYDASLQNQDSGDALAEKEL